jgi:malate synthase|tara:strand:- start:47415 stop:47567 length:153 start_codon:yes stop_codon:yes gene_type:complete
MILGPATLKEKKKDTSCLQAYEDGNDDAGLDVGLLGHNKIGRGCEPNRTN